MKKLEQKLEEAKTYKEKLSIFRNAQIKSFKKSVGLGVLSSIPLSILAIHDITNQPCKSPEEALAYLGSAILLAPAFALGGGFIGVIGGLVYDIVRYHKKHPQLYDDSNDKYGGLLGGGAGDM